MDPGIYRKFRVERMDGSSGPGGKHEACSYFVLDWKHDPFAVPAARAYAVACEGEFPSLADNLRSRADDAAAQWARLGPDATRRLQEPLAAPVIVMWGRQRMKEGRCPAGDTCLACDRLGKHLEPA